MTISRYISRLAIVLLYIGLTAVPAQAGIWDSIADAATKSIEKNVKKTTHDTVDGAFNTAKDAVKCAITDQTCIKRAGQQGHPVLVTDANGNVVKQIPAGAGGVGPVDANYDFEPGERTLFADDFSRAIVGNFPRNLEFQGGTLDVVALQSGRALRAKTKGAFDIQLPETLSKRFTIEFEAYTSEFVNDFRVEIINSEGKPAGTHYIQLDGYHGSGVAAYKRGGIASLQTEKVINKRMVPIEVMVDDSYVKVYVNKTRVANIPNANLGRSDTLRFRFSDVRKKPIYIADIRIASGGRDMYGALAADGRVAVHDILFDSGRATINPASARSLAKIGEMLKQHPELELMIEGHTDNQGEFDHNMQLSNGRAAAVKTYLSEKLDIAADRLRTMGLGSTQPVADNDTADGRHQNRRVELVKI